MESEAAQSADVRPECLVGGPFLLYTGYRSATTTALSSAEPPLLASIELMAETFR